LLGSHKLSKVSSGHCFIPNISVICSFLDLLTANRFRKTWEKTTNEVMDALGILLNHFKAVPTRVPTNILQRMALLPSEISLLKCRGALDGLLDRPLRWMVRSSRLWSVEVSILPWFYSQGNALLLGPDFHPTMLWSQKLSWSLIQVLNSSLHRRCSYWFNDSSRCWRNSANSFCNVSLFASTSARCLFSSSRHRARSPSTCFKIASFSYLKPSICCIISSMVGGSPPLLSIDVVVMCTQYKWGRLLVLPCPMVGANVPIRAYGLGTRSRIRIIFPTFKESLSISQVQHDFFVNNFRELFKRKGEKRRSLFLPSFSIYIEVSAYNCLMLTTSRLSEF